MVIPAEILESPWVILPQFFFFLKMQLMQLNHSGHFFLWKHCCMLNSMNILIMLQAASCPFSFFSSSFFFFFQYYFPFWRWLHFLCSYYIQRETPGINKGRYFPSNPISKWLLIVLLIGQRAQKGRTTILDSFRVLKTVNKVLSQP